MVAYSGDRSRDFNAISLLFLFSLFSFLFSLFSFLFSLFSFLRSLFSTTNTLFYWGTGHVRGGNREKKREELLFLLRVN